MERLSSEDGTEGHWESGGINHHVSLGIHRSIHFKAGSMIYMCMGPYLRLVEAEIRSGDGAAAAPPKASEGEKLENLT